MVITPQLAASAAIKYHYEDMRDVIEAFAADIDAFSKQGAFAMEKTLTTDSPTAVDYLIHYFRVLGFSTKLTNVKGNVHTIRISWQIQDESN